MKRLVLCVKNKICLPEAVLNCLGHRGADISDSGGVSEDHVLRVSGHGWSCFLVLLSSQRSSTFCVGLTCN